jgi:hypothetical protein
MATDYANIRLRLLGFDRATDSLAVYIDIDGLWSDVYELTGISDEQLVQSGEFPVAEQGVGRLALRLSERLDFQTHSFYLSLERVAGDDEPLTPMRLLEHKGGGNTRTSCDASLWEPVHYPPGRSLTSVSPS